MNTPAAMNFGPIEQLRARFHNLASNPRIKLLPEGDAIMRELVDFLDELADLAKRVAVHDAALYELAKLAKLARDPGDCD